MVLHWLVRIFPPTCFLINLSDLIYNFPHNSLAFLLVPILFNVTIAWKIIDNQKSRETRRWWKTYPSTALIFTFISCIDLEALNFVSSRCAGNDALNPRFTNEGRKQIATST